MVHATRERSSYPCNRRASSPRQAHALSQGARRIRPDIASRRLICEALFNSASFHSFQKAADVKLSICSGRLKGKLERLQGKVFRYTGWDKIVPTPLCLCFVYSRRSPLSKEIGKRYTDNSPQPLVLMCTKQGRFSTDQALYLVRLCTITSIGGH
jgi:hypothetical protein